MKDANWPWKVMALSFVAITPIAFVQPAGAASASFTSTSTRPAISALQSNVAGVGIAINARVATETAGSAAVNGVASSTGEAVTMGIRGESRSSAGRGVYGLAGAPNGVTTGVWGQSGSPSGRGVYGVATASGGGIHYGVVGQATGGNGRGVAAAGDYAGVEARGNVNGIVTTSGSDVPGDGSYGLASTTDLRLNGHVLSVGNGGPPAAVANLAAQCRVAAGASSARCVFRDPFPLNATPIVTVTPTTNPGSAYWVTPELNASGRADAFRLTLAAAPTTDVVFNYIVVGLLNPIAVS